MGKIWECPNCQHRSDSDDVLGSRYHVECNTWMVVIDQDDQPTTILLRVFVSEEMWARSLTIDEFMQSLTGGQLLDDERREKILVEVATEMVEGFEVRRG